MVEVSRSLMAVLAVGVKEPLCLGHSLQNGEPIPLFFITHHHSENVLIHSRVFQSLAGPRLS